jgi:predicted TIM-barrel fold metal-dependent hydrolase
LTEVIDVHTHIYPPAYIALLKGRSAIPRVDERDGKQYFVIFPEEERIGGRPIEPPMSSIDAKLAFMREAGIDRSVVSLGNPWLDFISGTESIAWAHRINAELAGLEKQSGGKIHALGVLPNAKPDEIATVVGEVAATSGLYGVISGCGVGGRTLDDPELDPVWSALARTGLPIFFHPHYAAAIDLLGGFGTALPLGIGFPMETSIAIARLVMSGVLQRHPDLKIMVAHSGGVLPFLAARLDVTWRGDPVAQSRLSAPPSTFLSKLCLDTVSYHPRAMHAAADLVGADQIVFGTDHPFFKEKPREILAGVEAAFAGQSLAKAAGLNAVSYFGLPT